MISLKYFFVFTFFVFSSSYTFSQDVVINPQSNSKKQEKKVSGKNQYDYVKKRVFWTILNPFEGPSAIKSIRKWRKARKYKKMLKAGTMSSVPPYLEWKNPEHRGKSCHEVCPLDLGMIQQFSSRMFPSNDDYLLSFTNDVGVFTDSYARTVGYCWGHTTVTRNFNYLALYDAENILGSDVPSERDKRKWKKFYENKIKRIVEGKAEVIPYFSNLYEFSNHPELVEYFKDRVIKNWYDNTVNTKNLTHLFDSLPFKMKPSKVRKKLKLIENSIKKGIIPKLIIFSEGIGYVHIVSAFKVERHGDLVKVCLLDNHQFSDGLNRCQASLDIRKTSKGYKMYYYGWDTKKKNVKDGRVRSFNFSVDNNYEAYDYIKSTNKLCRKLTACKR